jgi:hypothetical protein
LANEFGSQAVSLDITKHGQKVFILLDRKCLEPPLPDMAAASVVAMVAADVGSHQPLHPPAQVAVRSGSQHQMKVIGHQAIAQDVHGQALARGFQGDEGSVVLVLMEDLVPAVAAIEDVIDPVSQGSASGAWHAATLAATGPAEK